jgi:hypothetical protein
MSDHWKKPKQLDNGIIQTHNQGDILVSGSTSSFGLNHENNSIIRTHTISDLEILTTLLPDKIKSYTHECLQEHAIAICNILSLGYEADELFFRDYLSGPRNEISSHEIDILMEAFNDDRYDLVPTIIFRNKNLENQEDDINETSALFVEFHKRGMAF